MSDAAIIITGVTALVAGVLLGLFITWFLDRP
jgi:F0F1-type ATP synthase assembly protein I